MKKVQKREREKKKIRDWLSGSVSDRSDKVHHGLAMRSRGKYAEPDMVWN